MFRIFVLILEVNGYIALSDAMHCTPIDSARKTQSTGVSFKLFRA